MYFCCFRNFLLQYKQLQNNILFMSDSYESDRKYAVIAGFHLYVETWYHSDCTDFVF